MRILFCNYEYPPLGGGGGVVNAQLAEELAKRHDVVVLTSRGLGLPRESVQNGVHVVRVPVFFRRRLAAANIPSMLAYLPMGVREGSRLLGGQPFDLINSHFVLPTGPVGDRLARGAEIPHVISVHGGDLFDPSKAMSPHRHAVLRFWIRRLLGRADAVIGQSRNTVENVARYYRDDIDVQCIPLGIRRPGAGEARRADYGFTASDVLLVTVGRLVARKSVEQLVTMLARLGVPEAKLVVVGSGPEERRLRDDAARLNVTDRVRFAGRVSEEEKLGLLRMADLFVSSSQHEGFGLVFLEAMACGLPVVAYDHGGQGDFLADGETGHLVPLNDLDTLVERCRQLARQPERRARIGAANRKLAEAFYIDRCALEYERSFEAVIRASRQTGGVPVRTSR